MGNFGKSLPYAWTPPANFWRRRGTFQCLRQTESGIKSEDRNLSIGLDTAVSVNRCLVVVLFPTCNKMASYKRPSVTTGMHELQECMEALDRGLYLTRFTSKGVYRRAFRVRRETRQFVWMKSEKSESVLCKSYRISFSSDINNIEGLFRIHMFRTRYK